MSKPTTVPVQKKSATTGKRTYQRRELSTKDQQFQAMIKSIASHFSATRQSVVIGLCNAAQRANLVESAKVDFELAKTRGVKKFSNLSTEERQAMIVKERTRLQRIQSRIELLQNTSG